MVQIDDEPNAGKAWTDEEITVLRRLAAERIPTREIADRLGRSEYSIRSKARLSRISLQSNLSRQASSRSVNRPR
jgi:hypothetical protein